jgi:hypothetical protein
MNPVKMFLPASPVVLLTGLFFFAAPSARAAVTMSVLTQEEMAALNKVVDNTATTVAASAQVRYTSNAGGSAYQAIGQSFKWTSSAPMTGLGVYLHSEQRDFITAQDYSITVYKISGAGSTATYGDMVATGALHLTAATISATDAGKYLYFSFGGSVAMTANSYYAVVFSADTMVAGQVLYLARNGNGTDYADGGLMIYQGAKADPPAATVGSRGDMDMLFFVTANELPLVPVSLIDGIDSAPGEAVVNVASGDAPASNDPYVQARNSSSYRAISQSFKWTGAGNMIGAGFKLHTTQAAFTTSQKYIITIAKAGGGASNATMGEMVFRGAFALNETNIPAGAGEKYLHVDLSEQDIEMTEGGYYWMSIGPDPAGATSQQLLFVTWFTGTIYTDGVAAQPQSMDLPATVPGSNNDLCFFVNQPLPRLTVSVLDAVPYDTATVMIDTTGAAKNTSSGPTQTRNRQPNHADYRRVGQSFRWTAAGPMSGIGFVVATPTVDPFTVNQPFTLTIYNVSGPQSNAAVQDEVFSAPITLTPDMGAAAGKYLYFDLSNASLNLTEGNYYLAVLGPRANSTPLVQRLFLEQATDNNVYTQGTGAFIPSPDKPETIPGSNDLLFFVTTPAPVVKGDIVDLLVAGPAETFFAYPHHNGFYNGLPVLGKPIGGGSQQLIQYNPETEQETVLATLDGMTRSFSYYDIAENGMAVMWGTDTTVTVADLTGQTANRVIYTAPAGCVLHMPTINPAGTKVTVTVGKGPDPAWDYSLVEIDIESGVASTLTTKNFQINHAQYSPFDPDWICFSMNAGDPHRTWMWHPVEAPGGKKIFDPQTGAGNGLGLNVGHERPMFNKAALVTCAYITSNGTPKGLYEVGFDNTIRNIYTGDSLHCNISRDGKWAVFDTIGDWVRGDVVVVNFATGAAQVLMEGVAYTVHPYHVHPHISPDGNWIIYNDNNTRKVMFIKVNREKLEALVPGVNDAPVITSFAPQTLAAGTTVAIVGTDFFNVTKVEFDGIDAATFKADPSGTTITATAPAGLIAPGFIKVTTLNGHGTSGTQFTVPSCTIGSFSPQIVGAGTVVTINGSGFNNVQNVKFAGIDAISFTVDSAARITAVFPSGITEAGTITVTTPVGTGESATLFTLKTAPDDLVQLLAPIVAPGGKTVLTASASGAPEPSYVWQVSFNNGQWLDIGSSGAQYEILDNGRTLVINTGDSVNACRYRYLADNGVGAPVASNEVALTISAGAMPGPVALVMDAGGELYVADDSLNIIQRIHGLGGGASGTISVFAGASGTAGASDGTGTGALFNLPTGLAVANGVLYVADTQNNAIRSIDASGAVTRWAGLTGSADPATDGSRSPFGAGLPSARLGGPAAIALTHDGVMYIADSQSHAIRRVLPDGTVDTIAGKLNRPGSLDILDTGTLGIFKNPSGIALDETEENLYVADTGNHTIRKVELTGGSPAFRVSTLAGTAGAASWADRNGTAARFNSPRGMAVIGGTLYIADAANHAIRALDLASADVTTIAGSPELGDSLGIKDGTGTNALFSLPMDVTPDINENLYVADSGNGAIRHIDRSNNNTVSTLALAPATTENPDAAGLANPDHGGGGGGGAMSLWCVIAAGLFVAARRAGRIWNNH